MQYFRRLISTLFWGGALLVGSFSVLASSNPQNTIKVMGTGQVMAVPDRLNFNILLREQGRSVSKLYASVNQNSNLIINYLSSQKIADNHIQSMAIQVNPWVEYENQRQVQKGFELSRIMTVTLEDSERLGTLLDHLFRISNVEISGVNLLLTNRQKHYNEAMRMAIATAKAKAQLIAKNLSVSLGGAVSFLEMSTHTIPGAEMMMKTANTGNTFLPGEVSVIASVKVEFIIQ